MSAPAPRVVNTSPEKLALPPGPTAPMSRSAQGDGRPVEAEFTDTKTGSEMEVLPSPFVARAVRLYEPGAGLFHVMAYGLSGALRLSWTPADVMAEPSSVTPQRTPVPAPVGAVTMNRRTHRLDVAAKAVTDAGQGAKGVLNVIVTGTGTDEDYRIDRTELN